MLRLLTTGQAAKMLGVDKATVGRWVREQKLPNHIRTVGGQMRIPVEDVERLVGHTNSRKALLFLRVPGDAAHLLDKALAHLASYAQSRNFTIVDIVKEVGPGLQHRRPALAGLREEIRGGAPRFSTIIVERLDRLILLGADEFVLWARPLVHVEVAGASCREAEIAYEREALFDLYYPLLDTLALWGIRPDEAENIVGGGLESIAQALGL